jgi:hypothetical protein
VTHSLRSVQAWAKSDLPPGQALRQPAPLFRTLDGGRRRTRGWRSDQEAARWH